MLNVIMLSVTFYLLLCRKLLCRMSLCWVSWRSGQCYKQFMAAYYYHKKISRPVLDFNVIKNYFWVEGKCTQLIPTLYRLYTDFIPILYRLYTDFIPTLYWLYNDFIPSLYRLNTDLVPTWYQLNSDMYILSNN